MNYIIGVDAGGTKTEAIAYSLEDQELGIGLSGYGNLYMNFDKATEHIIQAIEQCRINACGQGAEECLGIYLGIAGIEVQDYAAKIDALLTNQYHCRVCGLHDSVLAHAVDPWGVKMESSLYPEQARSPLVCTKGSMPPRVAGAMF